MREVVLRGRPLPATPGCCIIAGGETTVTIKGDGKGGKVGISGGGKRGGGRDRKPKSDPLSLDDFLGDNAF